MAEAAVIISAASRIGVSGSQTTGAPRISEPTGWVDGSLDGPGEVAYSSASALASDRATYRSPAGAESSSRAMSLPIR